MKLFTVDVDEETGSFEISVVPDSSVKKCQYQTESGGAWTDMGKKITIPYDGSGSVVTIKAVLDRQDSGPVPVLWDDFTYYFSASVIPTPPVVVEATP